MSVGRCVCEPIYVLFLFLTQRWHFSQSFLFFTLCMSVCVCVHAQSEGPGIQQARWASENKTADQRQKTLRSRQREAARERKQRRQSQTSSFFFPLSPSSAIICFISAGKVSYRGKVTSYLTQKDSAALDFRPHPLWKEPFWVHENPPSFSLMCTAYICLHYAIWEKQMIGSWRTQHIRGAKLRAACRASTICCYGMIHNIHCKYSPI